MLTTKIATNDRFTLHLTGNNHPESPNRYLAIKNGLEAAGLLTEMNRAPERQATVEEVALAHSRSYIELVKREASTCDSLLDVGQSSSLSTGDVQISNDSYAVALWAVGSALASIDEVLNRRCDNSFSLLRPPGHHACYEKGMGFCLFNNAAIAARYAQITYKIQRVAIIDWDVHHGNGTQEIFYNDPSVFYFSTHQWPLYPGTGATHEKGCGNILNVPIAGTDQSRYHVLDAFSTQLPAAMDIFRPQLLVISAGFDGHKEDPLGGFNLTSHDFGVLTYLVGAIAKKWTGGRIVSLLEGGYGLKGLAESAVAHVQALNNLR